MAKKKAAPKPPPSPEIYGGLPVGSRTSAFKEEVSKPVDFTTAYSQGGFTPTPEQIAYGNARAGGGGTTPLPSGKMDPWLANILQNTATSFVRPVAQVLGQAGEGIAEGVAGMAGAKIDVDIPDVNVLGANLYKGDDYKATDLASDALGVGLTVFPYGRAAKGLASGVKNAAGSVVKKVIGAGKAAPKVAPKAAPKKPPAAGAPESPSSPSGGSGPSGGGSSGPKGGSGTKGTPGSNFTYDGPTASFVDEAIPDAIVSPNAGRQFGAVASTKTAPKPKTKPGTRPSYEPGPTTPPQPKRDPYGPQPPKPKTKPGIKSPIQPGPATPPKVAPVQPAPPAQPPIKPAFPKNPPSKTPTVAPEPVGPPIPKITPGTTPKPSAPKTPEVAPAAPKKTPKTPTTVPDKKPATTPAPSTPTTVPAKPSKTPAKKPSTTPETVTPPPSIKPQPSIFDDIPGWGTPRTSTIASGATGNVISRQFIDSMSGDPGLNISAGADTRQNEDTTQWPDTNFQPNTTPANKTKDDTGTETPPNTKDDTGTEIPPKTTDDTGTRIDPTVKSIAGNDIVTRIDTPIDTPPPGTESPSKGDDGGRRPPKNLPGFSIKSPKDFARIPYIP